MRKILIMGMAAAVLALAPVTFTATAAQARLGRPGTPFSVAGVHRRAMRHAWGGGWRVGGIAPRRVWHAYRWHRPLAAAAILGAGAYGAGYYGGNYGGGCTCGAPGYGGWGSGAGWRPGFGFGAPGFGWHRGWDRGWGW